jgi:hypothetical protein
VLAGDSTLCGDFPDATLPWAGVMTGHPTVPSADRISYVARSANPVGREVGVSEK